ncbi:YugN-like family protein [Paenibacillus sp. J5C_2022]|uniref:YugN-like family protein n=1 Tax=Paenibacillus sp. J5C2022 TaxID=2977129 RepID=UPI0021CF42E7|nr:YugN-like family protein [Paenibacillus sp. J5C2022]MCU6709869.1 YugN-like family protein [Paenibacillus sp. J5C2022]
MIPLSSVLEGQEHKLTELQVKLEKERFSLGGNWDYDNGSFDRALDEENKVWLRIPFQVTDGSADSELSENNARVVIGSPYILKHVYNEGNDPEASARVVGAMFDQFQSPTDPDADVEPHWIERGREVLQAIEPVISR